jgi:hypothetical protein
MSEPKKKRVFNIWPTVPGTKYGPSFKQKLAWIEKLPPKLKGKYAHQHDLDILLLLGGTRSGKTATSVARCLYIARKYPKSRIIVGSLNFNHLEETVIEDYKKLLTKVKEWDHPSILRKPNRTHKRLVFRNGSVISFVNLENFMRTLGSQADIIHIEEPELLKSADALEVLLTRLSSPVVPFKQVILTANPTEDLGWMIDWFKLEQFQEGWDGDKTPIGKPCECHICVKCQRDKKNVEYINKKCPVCGHEKKNNCPGNQYFQRVILSDASDNEHLPENYQRNLAATLSYDKMQRFGKGFVLHRKKGRIYTCFHGGNVMASDKEINPDKDLIWALDFNQHPQCSVICQEYKKDGLTHVDVLDEIVLWGAGPEQVANEFISRYKNLGLKKKVRIYGDPTGFNGAIKNLVLSRFHTLVETLEKKGKFDVDLVAAKTLYPVALRLDSVNWMMRDGNDYVRLHINPSCRHVTLGAEKIEWDNAGKKENENCDIKARSKGKQGDLWLMTHPMAALGYFIVKDHPMIAFDEKEKPFIANPASGTVITTDDEGNVIERQYTEAELTEIEDMYGIHSDDEDDDLDDDEEFGISPIRQASIASLLRKSGSWGN